MAATVSCAGYQAADGQAGQFRIDALQRKGATLVTDIQRLDLVESKMVQQRAVTVSTPLTVVTSLAVDVILCCPSVHANLR